MQLLHPIATAEDYDHAARIWAVKAGLWVVVAMVVASYGAWWALLPGLMVLLRGSGSIACIREAARIRQRFSSLLD